MAAPTDTGSHRGTWQVVTAVRHHEHAQCPFWPPYKDQLPGTPHCWELVLLNPMMGLSEQLIPSRALCHKNHPSAPQETRH